MKLSLNTILQRAEDIALTDHDLALATNNQANIVIYDMLDKYNNVQELFMDIPGQAIILLYQFSNSDVGHWIVLLKKGRVLEHFDSLGYGPDYEVSMDHHDNLHYTRLLSDARNRGYRVESNPYRLQEQKYHVNTCGRWCITRVNFRELSNKEFNELMTKPITISNPDMLVTALTLMSSLINKAEAGEIMSHIHKSILG